MNTQWAKSFLVRSALPALLAAGAMHSAGAAELGFYVGGYYGKASRDAQIEDFDTYGAALYDLFGFTPTQTTSKLDDSHATYGFEAGYRLTPHIAIEGGYGDIGVVAYRAVSPGEFPDGPTTLNLNVDSEMSGITLSALGILPLTYRMEVYARVGAVFATNTLKTFVADSEGNTARDEFSESSTDYLAGVGASFSFLEIYNARLEFQRIFDAGDESTGEGDLDQVSLGITVGF